MTKMLNNLEDSPILKSLEREDSIYKKLSDNTLYCTFKSDTFKELLNNASKVSETLVNTRPLLQQCSM